MERLMQIAHEMDHKLEPFQPLARRRLAAVLAKRRYELLEPGDNAIIAAAIARGVVPLRADRNIHEVPRCCLASLRPYLVRPARHIGQRGFVIDREEFAYLSRGARLKILLGNLGHDAMALTTPGEGASRYDGRRDQDDC
jgi:hypothetical protein